jgi:uncharacterized protein with beta-barrel porin domain
LDIGTGRVVLVALLAALGIHAFSAAARAQLDFITYQFGNSAVTTVTGIRGDNMTGNYSIANSGGATGGLLFGLTGGTISPFPSATSDGSNFPGSISSTPYGPSFGSPTGILRVVGSYKTTVSNPFDLGYFYDGAATPGQQITTLIYPGGSTLNTIAHSNFGNQIVGNYDTSLTTGNAFLYDIPTGTFTTNNKPGAVSTTAYGVYGNRIAGGAADPLERGYIYNQDTATFTSYNAPAAVATHFEGITGAGRANTFNLVADSLDVLGHTHAWAVHVNALGIATWTEIAVPGATLTSANSIYQDKLIGVYVTGGVTRAYLVTVPGIYDSVTNSTSLSFSVPGTTAIAGGGDDVANSGSILMSGANSVGISGGIYGVITNTGSVAVTGAGSTAVLMTDKFGSLLNAGTIRAAPGGTAIGTDNTALGTLVVNNGIVDGQVSMAAGPDARFENSGWLGISSVGAGTAHALGGTFAQTPAGTLALRLSPATSDSLAVSGPARLAGTALAVFQPGTYVARSYTILSASGGRTGTFDALATQNMPGLLSASLSYGATGVILNLQAASQFLPGLGGNQVAVGRVLDAAFNSGAGLNAMPGIFGVSAANMPHALSVLSGDSASLGQAVSFAAGGQFASLAVIRAESRRAADLAEACDREKATACEPERPAWGVWTSAFGAAQWLNADATTGSAAAQQSIGGGAFGGDYRVGPHTLVGIAAGLSSWGYSVPATGASGQATGAHFGLYGLQELGSFQVGGSLAYSRFDGTATRPIIGVGASETARSAAVSHQLAGRLELGRPFDTGGAMVTPFVAVQPAELWQPGILESSVTANGTPGVFALSYQPQATLSLPLFLGLQVDGESELHSHLLKGWARMAWVHEFLTARSVTAGFTVLPGSFTVDGARAASDSLRVDFGSSYAVAAATSLFVNGAAELSDRGQSIAGTAGVRFVW